MRGFAIHHLLREDVIARTAAFDHVAGQVKGAPQKPMMPRRSRKWAATFSMARAT